MKLNFKNIGLFLTLVVISFSELQAQSKALLSEESQISVITFGPYQGELWSAFGHSGIRVYDPKLNIDWMYDWGRFDFDQENFYWNFARGKMLYSIGRTRNFPRYKDYYINEDRYIYEQIINLDQQERQAFFDALEENYLPENRNYYYNYVYDNCATRIRDVAVSVISDSIYFPYSYKVPEKSVRDLMDDYLPHQPWGDFIIDVALGNEIDQEADPEIYMYLPDYIYKGFKEATIIKVDTVMPLVSRENIIYEASSEEPEKSWFTPFNVFLILFFVVGLITNRDFKKKKRTKWIDYLLFSVVGVFGWWFVFLWFGTVHISTQNWNLIWAFPLHIPFVFLLNKAKWQYPLSRVYRFLAVLHALTLVFWFAFPQPLHQALVPLLITLILRSFYISYDLSKV